VSVDGRMLPHEWIQHGDKFLKADALDHGDDHFFTGSQDVAWDIAGACVEFSLSSGQRRQLIGAYRKRRRDPDIDARLPFYEIAYLSFRLGYAVMAAEALRGSLDGSKFSDLSRGYACRLRSGLARLVS